MRGEELSERWWSFAARVGGLVDALPDTRLGRHVGGQLVRCSMASVLNYDEAGSAENRDDFAQKIGIAKKELREACGWLRLVVKSRLLSAPKVSAIADEAEQLLKSLSKAVQAAKQRGDLAPAAILSQPTASSSLSGFQGLDHIAIAVLDTQAALKLWRDTFGFTVLYSEDVNGGTVRLTHLDLGNTQLQLVQPLSPDHPLQAWLTKNGPGLHHFCLKVENVAQAKAASPVPAAPRLHQGTQGKRALFLDKAATQNIQVELTGA